MIKTWKESFDQFSVFREVTTVRLDKSKNRILNQGGGRAFELTKKNAYDIFKSIIKVPIFSY